MLRELLVELFLIFRLHLSIRVELDAHHKYFSVLIVLYIDLIVLRLLVFQNVLVCFILKLVFAPPAQRIRRGPSRLIGLVGLS
jgi:hypothetical protein